jgi:hypothetical protein
VENSEDRPFSLSEKELLKQSYGLFLIKGKVSNGDHFYMYVAVRMDRVELFKACLEKRDAAAIAKLDECARILESGAGEPSAEVTARIEQEYGLKLNTTEMPPA